METLGKNKDAILDRKTAPKEIVYALLPDVLMITLAVVMIPIVLIPLFVDLPASVAAAFQFVDYTILAIFVLEYLLKTIFASDVLKHILNPWHLLDLFIIIVPLVSLLPMVSFGLGRTSLFLRLLRIIRIVAMGGRAVDRKIKLDDSLSLKAPAHVSKPMEIQVVDGSLANVYQGVPFNNLQRYLADSSQTWINISSVSEKDLDNLSGILAIPRLLLESELADESYPRVDYFENSLLIFTRLTDLNKSQAGATRLVIDRQGVLIICQGQNIITLSKSKVDIFSQILKKGQNSIASEEPLVVAILYDIFKYILQKDKQIIGALEHELMILENIPLNKRPRNFLEITFHLRKEANQIVPSLLHFKEIISVITTKRVPLEGFSERHEKIFDILLDEAIYLHETASNARDNLLSLVDLFINNNSYETNKVMRAIAVITSLGIIPAVMGLLGSNVAGNPWNIQLWQVFGLLGIFMFAMGWIFYRMGWLKW